MRRALVWKRFQFAIPGGINGEGQSGRNPMSYGIKASAHILFTNERIVEAERGTGRNATCWLLVCLHMHRLARYVI